MPVNIPLQFVHHRTYAFCCPQISTTLCEPCALSTVGMYSA